MSTFKAIVFDYDGTLFDTRPAIVYCIQRAFEQQRRPVPAREPVLETVKTGLTLQDTFLILDDELRTNRAALNEIVRTYRTLYLNEAAPLLKPFAGASEALQQLHSSGAKCLVVSNKGIAAIRQSLDDSGLSGFMDLIFGDEPGLPKKPDPAIVMDHISAQICRSAKSADTDRRRHRSRYSICQRRRLGVVLGVLWLWRCGALPGARTGTRDRRASANCRHSFIATEIGTAAPAPL